MRCSTSKTTRRLHEFFVSSQRSSARRFDENKKSCSSEQLKTRNLILINSLWLFCHITRRTSGPAACPAASPPTINIYQPVLLPDAVHISHEIKYDEFHVANHESQKSRRNCVWSWEFCAKRAHNMLHT